MRSWYPGLSKVSLLAALLLYSSSVFGVVTLLDEDEWTVQMGGFAEVDMFHDSTRSFTESPGSTAVSTAGSLNGDNGRTQFSVRNSRLAFGVMAPTINDWKTKGYLEFDLLGYSNGPSESALITNPTMRVRHAYVSAQNGGFQVLAGQYWALLGWQTYYLLPTLAVPAVTGEDYQRTPQLLVMDTFGSVQAALALSRPTQRDSEIPNLDVGLRYSANNWKTLYANSPSGDVTVQPMSIAVTSTLREFEGPANDGVTTDKTHQTGYAVAVNAMIPIFTASENQGSGNSLLLSGEYTTGEGYTDYFPSLSFGLGQFPATVGNTVQSATEPNLDAGYGGYTSGGVFELVKMQTFNLNLQYQLPADLHTWVDLGYGQIQSSNAVLLGASTYRYDILFANVYHDFTKNVRLGFEYGYYRSKYASGAEPSNTRVQMSAWFRL